MKQNFKSGFILGLIVGVAGAYFFSHLWLWLFVGVAVGIMIAASGMSARSFSRLRWGK